MYLKHFGLNEPPFRITPGTEFFFSGANRGEVLDALIYSVSESEGIIKVSGEVGIGKTTLCRMLLERLPDHIETIYLANPSLSREEMLYAIADGLGLNIEGERVGVIMRNIENKLGEKTQEGKRIVILVDEAHAMPLDTLEELRLLYNLQIGNTKLLQIVLFGQPELNDKLDQPGMRQLKDRIVHNFHMQPLSRAILDSYLMFRLRAAGYHGPNLFSPRSIKLIASASGGLMRRVNIIADKCLLAAFIEDTYYIKPQHVQAALRDSESDAPTRSSSFNIWMIAFAIAVLLIGLAIWWMMRTEIQMNNQAQVKQIPVAPTAIAVPAPAAEQPAVSSVPATENPANGIGNMSKEKTGNSSLSTTDQAPKQENKVSSVPHTEGKASRETVTMKSSLFDQRLEAGKLLLEQKQAVSGIQLFYHDVVKKDRIEGFLKRAKILGKLDEIYLVPAKFGEQEGLRIIYGAYASVREAKEAIDKLPEKYKKAFATAIYLY